MIEAFNNIIFISSLILLGSILLSKFSNKFGFPILLLFLGIGMIAGKEGLGGIEYSNYELSHTIALMAICIIIFSGGLMTKVNDIRPVMRTGVLLSTLGVLLTTALIGSFCYYFLTIPFFESLLIGATLSSTDAAAVFTVFSSKKSQVNKKIKSLLELEAGSNDPMTYLLITIFLGLYQAHTYSGVESIELLVLNPVIGFAGGFSMYYAFKFINDSIKLEFKGLYPALTIAFLFLTYSMTTLLKGNGFLAIYIFAIMLGNTKLVHKKALVDFFDGSAWLSQIGLFIMLGLLVAPSDLIEVAPQASIIALVLIFVARPIAVLLTTIKSQFNFKEKIFISWGGLKGASPIVFASLIATQMGKDTNLIFDIVFFTVLFSALIQGSTLRFMARKLKLQIYVVQDPEFPIDHEVLDKTKNGIKEITIHSTDFSHEKRVVDLDLPSGVLVLFVKRDGAFIIPNGSTEFLEKDHVLIVTPNKEDIEKALNHFQNGPPERVLSLVEPDEDEKDDENIQNESLAA
jgi:cell volume regulation protein A